MVEVVVALGIFGAGIVPVLAFFGSLAHSARANREAEAAAGIADALSIRLRALSFDTIAALLKTGAEIEGMAGPSGDDAAADRGLFYASLSGDRIGQGGDPVWDGHDRNRFFEITLIRNAELSPSERDVETAWIAFNVRVRWPAFQRRASGSAARTREADRMQMLLFSGSIRR